MLVIFMCTNFLIDSTNSTLSVLLVTSLKVKFLFPFSMFDTRGLVKSGRFSRQELALSSQWNRFASKLAVSGRMNLVADMSAYAKKAMRPNNFGKKFLFFAYPQS